VSFVIAGLDPATHADIELGLVRQLCSTDTRIRPFREVCDLSAPTRDLKGTQTMEPDPARGEAYLKNTQEQYEALGRFVEAFEDMVDEVRILCMDLLSRLAENPTHNHTHRVLLHIVLHHQALTAKPLFEILRAMIAEILKNDEGRKQYGIIDADGEVFIGALHSINYEYVDLVNVRNNLLHATWYIGCSDASDPESSEFFAYKGNSNKDGWAPLELPKKASELLDLSERCKQARNSVAVIANCLWNSETNLKIRECFQYDGSKWRCVCPHEL
jgi:hypothetical protein